MLKRDQAEVVFALWEMMETLEWKGRGRLWTDAAREKAEALKRKMHELNQKGPDARNAGAGWYHPTPNLFGIWERYNQPLPRAAMMLSGRIFPLPMLERPISATDGGALRGVPTPTTAPEAPCANSNKKNGPSSLMQFAWQTPVADDAMNRRAGKWNSRGEPKLSAQVKLLPTPTATLATHGGPNQRDSSGRPGLQMAAKTWPTPTLHGNHNRKGASPTSGDGLATAVRRWPTPSASDHRNRGNLSNPAIQRRVKIGKQIMLSMSVSNESGYLNPTWVEWLMGFPLCWGIVKGWKQKRIKGK